MSDKILLPRTWKIIWARYSIRRPHALPEVDPEEPPQSGLVRRGKAHLSARVKKNDSDRMPQ